ncbi:hypothetical protein [Gloeobacter violaceus]|uniref:Glr4051 protein n=1 Tax=Gloeobacter violaceus (strain ATCC 29082 / PCC 7421) TaxID=251221 RepID=Q7NE29_GLOVI|nr:hypothetical protein [Gloeobacter violaceus]BAC91992.1 glr4051 [Gloeobacter violaceus PCC 7421]
MIAADFILVPRGAEYEAVRQGVSDSSIVVIAIPAGPTAVKRFLSEFSCRNGSRIWSMGLCGSLSEQLPVGQVVVYRDCRPVQPEAATLACDPELVQSSLSRLERARLVSALGTDRVIVSAAEKQALARQFAVRVVDMESYTVLEALRPAGISVGVVRVVSDGAAGDLPDLSGAFDCTGGLQPLALAAALVRSPIAGARLVGGSLIALRVLQTVARRLLGPD